MKKSLFLLLIWTTNTFAGVPGDGLLRKCTNPVYPETTALIDFGNQKSDFSVSNARNGIIILSDPRLVSGKDKIALAELTQMNSIPEEGQFRFMAVDMKDQNANYEDFRYDFINEQLIMSNWHWEILNKSNLKCEVITE